MECNVAARGWTAFRIIRPGRKHHDMDSYARSSGHDPIPAGHPNCASPKWRAVLNGPVRSRQPTPRPAPGRPTRGSNRAVALS